MKNLFHFIQPLWIAENIFVFLMVSVLPGGFLWVPIGEVMLKNLDWEVYPGSFDPLGVVKGFMVVNIPQL